MFELVIGGSGSGKSAYAEDRAVFLGTRQRIYVATMQPFDQESLRKIKRHQDMRREKRFETVECQTCLEHITVPEGSTVLLECMSNLVANEMYGENGAKEQVCQAIGRGIRRLAGRVAHVIVVSNNVFEDGFAYDAETLRYMKNLGFVNQELGRMADRVTEVVHGIPLTVKDAAGRVS